MPSCPDKFAQCVEHIKQRTTPRKRSALSSRCILSPSKRRKLNFLEAVSVKTVFSQIKKRRSTRDIELRRILHQVVSTKKKLEKQMLHKHLGLSWNFLAKDQCPINSRQMRKDALADNVVSSVTAFYNRTDISREMPNARMVSKKTMTAKKVLESSMQAAYLQFKFEHRNIDISFSKCTYAMPMRILCQHRLQAAGIEQ